MQRNALNNCIYTLRCVRDPVEKFVCRRRSKERERKMRGQRREVRWEKEGERGVCQNNKGETKGEVEVRLVEGGHFKPVRREKKVAFLAEATKLDREKLKDAG